MQRQHLTPAKNQTANSIKWNSVHDSLPKHEVAVLAMIEGSDLVYTCSFNYELGWSFNTSPQRSPCDGYSPCNRAVKFWSYYNLPK